MYKIVLLIVTVYANFCLKAQDFTMVSLTQQDKQNGVLHIYSGGNFEVLNQLTLYKNKSFYYQYKDLGNEIFSRGKWIKKDGVFTLNSDIDSNNVPVKFFFFNTDTTKTYYDRTLYKDSFPPIYNTNFQLPVNLKGEPLLEAIVYINGEANYCFPFFDTCVGKTGKVEKVKINFGNGFKSKWLSLDVTDFRRALCVAQVDFLFTNYLSYKDYKLKMIGKILKHLD